MEAEPLYPTREQLMAIIAMQTEIAKLGPDLYGVMQLVAEECMRLVNAGGAVVELAEGDEMVYRSATGSAAGMLGLRLKRNSSLSELCVELASPLYCADSETDERVDREACRKVGVRSMVVVPLIHGNEVVGVLKVLSAEPAAFDEQDTRLLGQISELVAATMFYAGKYGVDELFKQATTDYLTQLANRALFYDHLRAEISLCQRKAGHFSIVMIDMDGLKPINDLYGHAAGDAALIALAVRIAGQAREMDTVARLGGDEFAIILPAVEKGAQLDAVMQRLESSFARPFLFNEQALPLSASIGCAVYPDDGNALDALIDHADRAMYEIKRRKKTGGVH